MFLFYFSSTPKREREIIKKNKLKLLFNVHTRARKPRNGNGNGNNKTKKNPKGQKCYTTFPWIHFRSTFKGGSFILRKITENGPTRIAKCELIEFIRCLSLSFSLLNGALTMFARKKNRFH